MKVLRLEAENVKRLKAIEIVPNGPAVIVGGHNGQGKSSVLDSIAYAIGGKDLVCEEPVHRGEAKARVTCDLGDIVVTRTFTAAGGGSLKVTNADGTPVASPQTMLDRLFGSLSFDPLAFSRMKSREQSETLRRLVGLDFSALDAERARLFEERTLVNREIKGLSASFEAMPIVEGPIPAEADIKDLAADLRRVRDFKSEQEAAEFKAKNAADRVRRAKIELEAAEQEEKRAREFMLAMRPPEGLAPYALNEDGEFEIGIIEQRMVEIQKENQKARAYADRQKAKRILDERTEQSDQLTKKIEMIDRTKSEALKATKFPIAGLSITDSGVTFNGLPFSQASSAEQLKVSVAIGLAMNPKLRVMLIRDGSLLDEDSLAVISEVAAAHDAQLWIERVSQGAECSVIIEDGEVVQIEKPF